MNQVTDNVDESELEKFESLADEWWDPDGKLRTLHHINPVRLQYIDNRVGIKDRDILDLGCGGGLLSEAMAMAGANVTGIDANATAIETAVSHSRLSGLKISYENTTAERYAEGHERSFDVIVCMELLEHVPDVKSLVNSCVRMLRPGGHIILSTINRTVRSYASVILAAEYLLGLLPRGTHDYSMFIRPSELAAWLRSSGFELRDVAGMLYIPGLQTCSITRDPSVNYLVHAVNGLTP